MPSDSHKREVANYLGPHIAHQVDSMHEDDGWREPADAELWHDLAAAARAYKDRRVQKPPEGQPDFWSVSKYEERLTHDEPEEAAAMWLDDMTKEEIAELPDEITVYGWRRTNIKGYLEPSFVLDEVLERLDEEHGDPDGDFISSITPKMIAATRALVQAIEEDYTPWTCKVCCEEKLDISAIKKEILE